MTSIPTRNFRAESSTRRREHEKFGIFVTNVINYLIIEKINYKDIFNPNMKIEKHENKLQ